MAPSIQLFTLDCLRESVCSDSVTPFLRSFPLQWSRCYSSGTWTVPSHASLLSGQDPIDHDVTRSESPITREHARLSKRANENGYETALFSENPRFSSVTGFDDCVDAAYDYINWKLLPSEFTPILAADGLSLSGGVQLSRDILSRPNRVSNLVNTGYTAYRHFTDRKSEYPHHGERVISHLESYLSDRTEPTLTVTNVLDPHNPYWGSPPGQSLVHSQQEDDALRKRQNFLHFPTDEPIPEEIRGAFGDWETCFAVEERIYKDFSRHTDRLMKRWHDELTSRFESDLVVVLGDHGQLFGAEGEVGHSISLHPHGVHVPLMVDPPAEWDASERTVSDPVSIAGLGRALMDVVSDDITSTTVFIEAITEYSRGPNNAVLACADGPTGVISRLYETDRFDDDRITERCVRKVACIRDEYVDVYACHWNESTVDATSYRYTETDRELVAERNTPPPPSDIDAWITQAPNSYVAPNHAVNPEDDQPEVVTKRLEDLGYR